MAEVYCAHDAIIDIGKLKPNPRNPNSHPQKQIELLAKIIVTQGWRAPITVSNRSGYIVRGHGRLEAARYAEITVIPVDYQDYDSDALEYADLIADNRIAELSENDSGTLKNLIEELDVGEIDIELTGYDEQAIEMLMTQVHMDDDEGDDEGEVDITASGEKELSPIECPECGFQWKA